MDSKNLRKEIKKVFVYLFVTVPCEFRFARNINWIVKFWE